jgi:hypothetical protein
MLKAIPDMTIIEAIKGTPPKRTWNPKMVPIAAKNVIKNRLAYQSAGTFRVAFQIGLIVRRIPIGPLNITTARIRATIAARDSME